MATKTEAAPRVKMKAKQAIIVCVGARPIEYQRRIVRDRHTGKLAEIDVHELPPVDEGDLGRDYAFAKGDEVWSDHEAVIDCPSGFIPVDD
jgi:hypothetical protein